MNITEIPTPRTDAEAVRGRSTAFPRASYFVDADFARQLERENVAMREVIKEVIAITKNAIWSAQDNDAVNAAKFSESALASIDPLKTYLP
jgi:hypothetical protein